ncbi:heavy-metal-associated domain-containing protein [Streptomyces sp. NBC_01020]|uniref:heavy-metal-associated domain-containing protein n=1 Tax=Streptomyces sp. NBC_01020 TaxID=2903722 RepID=UPI003862DCFC|nr:heavy-metal-associated domain-containing protein [Streptomyces sp. NBC_01020]
MNRIDYRVTGMSCGHCAAAIKKQVTAVGGVTLVDVHLERQTVRVEGSGLDDALLRAAIEEAGYQVAQTVDA